MTGEKARADAGIRYLAATIGLLIIQRLIYYYGQTWIKRPDVGYDPALVSTTNGSALITLMTLLAVVLMAFAAAYGFNRVAYRVKRRALMPAMLLLFGIAFWTLYSFFDVGVRNAFFDSAAPIVYSAAICVFVGMYPPAWRFVSKWAWVLALYYIVLSAGYTVDFMIRHPGMRNSIGPIVFYMVEGFWCLCVAALARTEQSPRYRALMLALIGGISVLALIYNSRGWVVQTLLLLGLYLLSRSRRVTPMRAVGAGAAVLVLGAAIFEVGLRFFPAQMENFLAKLYDDSRSKQYVELFYYTTPLQLLLGQGIRARYYSSTFGWYAYIDNQYLFALFRYGIFIIVPYVLLVARPALWMLLSAKGRHTRLLCAIVLLWLMALGGLSVYNAISIGVKDIMVMMVVGRLYALREGRPAVNANGEDGANA